MLGCNNNDYQGMRYARARKHTRHRASRSRLDGIHFLSPFRPLRDALSGIPAGTMRRIGVFVNESSENILLKAQEFGLHHIQLHGRETPEQCRKLKAAGLGIIKVFSIAREIDLRPVGCYEGICDYFLFDTACSGYGGSGKTFNWNILQAYRGKTPFLLSGGLRPGSLSSLLQFKHEQWAGIDLNSGFETAPALKDAAAVHTFINQLKQKIQ